MPHTCFISFKKEDKFYKNIIRDLLKSNGIETHVLDETINSDDIDYVLKVIRENYIQDSSVTLFLIGEHSKENEGYDNEGYYKNAFIKRELIASLMNKEGFDRNGIVGIVLPNMIDKIYGRKEKTSTGFIQYLNIDDNTVIKEFSKNFWLFKDNHCTAKDHYCVLVKYNDFIKNPNKYIDEAFDKRNNKELYNSVKVIIDKDKLKTK